MAKTTIIVKIKLVQVNFVPTTYEVDDKGNRLTMPRTVIGQLALDCEFLPDDVQAQLREIIVQAYATQIGAKDGSTTPQNAASREESDPAQIEIPPPQSRI